MQNRPACFPRRRYLRLRQSSWSILPCVPQELPPDEEHTLCDTAQVERHSFLFQKYGSLTDFYMLVINEDLCLLYLFLRGILSFSPPIFHKEVSAPTVGSKIPPVNAASRKEQRQTSLQREETITGFTPAAAEIRDTSLSLRKRLQRFSTFRKYARTALDTSPAAFHKTLYEETCPSLFLCPCISLLLIHHVFLFSIYVPHINYNCSNILY